MRLAGRNALITGASSGIGQATAIRFAQEGASVAINHKNDPDDADRVRQQVEQAFREAGIRDAKSLTVQADVADEQQVNRMFGDVISAFGTVDILVNNAGIQKPSPTEELELRDFEEVLNVNLKGAFLCSRAVVRHFLQRGARGVILNNTSVHEVIPKPKYLSYSISKGAIENMTKTMALEYAGRGIRVNAVGPGAVITPINKAWTNDPKARAEVESHIPMGRPAEAAEIAAVFAFLASDDASYITGQTIFACGGLTLYPEFRTTWSSGG